MVKKKSIYGRCFNPEGNQSSIFRINNLTQEDQSYPKIAMNKRGQFVVVWDNYGNHTIYGQVFGPNCTKIGVEFIVGYHLYVHYPVFNIDMLESGDFIVVWQDLTSDFLRDVSYGQKFHSSGGKINENFTISSTSKIKHPNVKFLNENKYVLSWTNFGRDKYYHGIFAQIYDINGN